MTDKVTFAVGGPVQAKAGTYLKRPADEALFKTCRAGEFAYVLACRQIGKSSLMYETAKKLRQDGIKTAIVDLNEIGKIGTSQDQWYFSLIDNLARGLEFNIGVDAWWQARPDLSTSTQRFLSFLREVVLQQISEPIVIFVDEIDSTLGLDFTDDFFAAIRTIYNERAKEHPIYKRVTFVLLGVATPDELIVDSTRTPFNIGQEIPLRDFTKEECQPFHQTIIGKYPQRGRQYFDQIYTWTKGHPYLTQKLCRAVVEASEPDQPKLVDTQVTGSFLAPEAYSEDNLYNVRKTVEGDPLVKEMLAIYKQVLQTEIVLDDERSMAINKLKLYGLVAVTNRRLAIRNKIYANAFNEEWVKNTLTALRKKREQENAKLPTELADKYRGHSRLAEEEYASIYLAEDLRRRPAGKTLFLALKIRKLDVSPNRSVAEEIERYRQFMKIQHESLINIFEVNSVDDQALYIAMEYISGKSLRERLETGPLPLDTSMEITKQIGGALKTLHKAEVIHCDVNPNNILLDTTGGSIKAVLTDFDAAKFIRENDNPPDDSKLVRVTPHYMALEQWTKGPVTPATDVYALAMTFFEMVVGRLPSKGNAIAGESDASLPKLSDLVPGFGTFFDMVLIQATKKDPSERQYQEADEFTRDLEKAYILQQKTKVKADRHLKQAQDEMKNENSTLSYVLGLINLSLKEYSNYLPALELRGKLYFERGAYVEALKNYQIVYEQTLSPDISLTERYLDSLEAVAEKANPEDAVTHYETINQILNKTPDQETVAERRERARTQLIKLYTAKGNEAYADRDSNTLDKLITALTALGAAAASKTLVSKKMFLQISAEYNTANAYYNRHHTSVNIDELTETIQVVTKNIEAIELLQSELQEPEASASKEIIAELHLMLDRLVVGRWEQIIKEAEVAIEEVRAKDKANPEIFKHYDKIEEAYQELLKIDTQNSQSISIRQRKALKEHAEYRRIFAEKAKDSGENRKALKHYRTLQKFEKAGFGDIVQEIVSELDIAVQIEDLERQVELSEKYDEIIHLLDKENYSEALEKIFDDFIRPGKYEYRNVAKLFWGLIYANQHEGKFPLAWKIAINFYYWLILLVIALGFAAVGINIGIEIYKWTQTTPDYDNANIVINNLNTVISNYHIVITILVIVLCLAIFNKLWKEPPHKRLRDD